MYVTTFVVEGHGSFPLDMLRYDACHPAHPNGVDGISLSRDNCMPDEYSKTRRVTLRTCDSHKTGSGPTKARWSSFGWTVIESITTKIS